MGIVYSTKFGRMCPECGKPAKKCACRKKPEVFQSDGVVRVSKQTKGRKGKGVTVVSGLSLEPAALKELARKLKEKCGSGGTVKDGTIEIQGDHRDRLLEALKKDGWTVKRSGG